MPQRDYIGIEHRRRKRMSANLGLISAGTGLGALSVQGGSTLAATRHKKLARIPGRGLGRASKVAIGLGAASGVAGAVGGINSALIGRSETSGKPVAIKILNKPVKKPISKKDIRASRDRRNKVYPYVAGAGAAALGGAAYGVPKGAKKLSVRYTRKLDETKTLRNQSAKNFTTHTARATKNKTTKSQLRNAILAAKDANATRKHTEKLGSYGMKLKATKALSGNKARIALGAGAVGVGALGVASVANNKRGFTKHRQNWWN